MNRKISVGMTVTIVILAMTVTFSITMLMAMRLFDHTVTSVKEKESMYNKVAEVDRYVRANDYYDIDETVLYDRLTAGYLLGTGDKYARYYTASAYTDLLNAQSWPSTSPATPRSSKCMTSLLPRRPASSGAITSPPSTAQTSKVWAAWRLSRTNSGARAARASM